jgi:hypothetical protein
VTAVDEAQALKLDGQARSAGVLTEQHRAAFRAALLTVPVGERLTVNTIREQLDAAKIPPSGRAALFADAAREGLIEQMHFSLGGAMYPMKVASTGTTARRAYVSVYERMDPRDTT